jgi:acetolactate synthase I/II/III large subunit
VSSSRTVARSFIEALERRGIRKVFANSGTDHAPIVEALSEMRAQGAVTPDFHVIPHENTAMAMAQGYYLVSGRPAVVLVHVTVGTANTLCSLMNARRSNIPVLLVAGRNPLSQQGHVGSRSVPIHWGQDAFDQNAMVREYTKWEHELRAYQDVDALVERALHIAMSEPRGPVYLTLPRELLADPDLKQRVAPARATTAAEPAAAAIRDAAGLLAGAERPAIVTSTAGVDREARSALEELAESHAIPVLQSWPFAVNIRSDHPMNLRSSGTGWLRDADLVLVVDAAVPWIPGRVTLRPDAVVIQMAADPCYATYPYRDFPAHRSIAGSTSAGLRGLAQVLKDLPTDASAVGDRRTRVAALQAAAGARRSALIEQAKHAQPIHAAWTARCINAVKADDAVVVNELGVPFECLEFGEQSVFVGETTAGGLGTGLGEALGAKLADPGRDVICCLGDGSFMFGNPTPALLVARALHIPVTIVVANNGMWYAVEHSTLDIFPDGAAAAAADMPLTKFGASPDYAAIAAACGAHGECVDDPHLLEAALRRALQQNHAGQAAVIDVRTAPGTR